MIIEPDIDIRLTRDVSKFARQLKQQSSKHDSEPIIVPPPPSESRSSGQSLSKNFRPSFNVRPLTTRTTQKALNDEEEEEEKEEDLDEDEEEDNQEDEEDEEDDTEDSS